MSLSPRIAAAATYLKSQVPFVPQMGLVLGSGLGDYADTLESPIRIP